MCFIRTTNDGGDDDDGGGSSSSSGDGGDGYGLVWWLGDGRKLQEERTTHRRGRAHKENPNRVLYRFIRRQKTPSEFMHTAHHSRHLRGHPEQSIERWGEESIEQPHSLHTARARKHTHTNACAVEYPKNTKIDVLLCYSLTQRFAGTRLCWCIIVHVVLRKAGTSSSVWCTQLLLCNNGNKLVQ